MYISRGLRIYRTHKYELDSTNTIVYAQCQSEGLVYVEGNLSNQHLTSSSLLTHLKSACKKIRSKNHPKNES